MHCQYSWHTMSVEKAESAAIRVIWRGPVFHYDLRWYGSADFIVPVWWIGLTHRETEELAHTEVFHPTTVAGDVFQWLLSLVGPDVAGRLHSLLETELSLQAAAAQGPQNGRRDGRRRKRRTLGRKVAVGPD
jgi:hypothetical protein